MGTCVRTALLSTLCLGLLLAPAQATTLLARTTAQLFADSDLVAVAKVRTVKAERVGSRIITRVTLEVAEGFKAAIAGSSVEVLIPGGQVGDWVQRVHGAPVVSEGERCVVFLTHGGGGIYRFTGLEQGKLRVEEDAQSSAGGVVRRTITVRLLEAPAAPKLTEPLKPYLESLRQLARGAR